MMAIIDGIYLVFKNCQSSYFVPSIRMQSQNICNI